MLGRVKNEIRFAAAWDDRQVAGLKSQEVNSQVNNSLYLHCKFLILLWEKKYLNERIIAHYVYFFTFHSSKTAWLAENLNEMKITHYDKIFTHIKQKFSHFEKGLGNVLKEDIFFVSLRLILFPRRYIALKLNQKIITKKTNYLT